jgi:hypothetical protein
MHIPRVVTCPQGVWTKIATAATRLVVERENVAASYGITYRPHGAAPPTAVEPGCSWEDKQFEVMSKRKIDVYIYVKISNLYSDGEVVVYG